MGVNPDRSRKCFGGSGKNRGVGHVTHREVLELEGGRDGMQKIHVDFGPGFISTVKSWPVTG